MAREYRWERRTLKQDFADQGGRLDLRGIYPGETLRRVIFGVRFFSPLSTFTLPTTMRLYDRLGFGLYLWPRGGAFPAPRPGMDFPADDSDNYLYWRMTDMEVAYTPPGFPTVGFAFQDTMGYQPIDCKTSRRATEPAGDYLQLTWWNREESVSEIRRTQVMFWYAQLWQTPDA